MGYIEHGIREIMTFLEHEKNVYTKVLERSPEGGLINENVGGRQRFLHCIPCGRDASGRRKYDRKTIRSEESQLLDKLAGKEYARSALRIIRHNLQVLARAMEEMKSYSAETILAGMRKTYRDLPEERFEVIRRASEVRRRQHEWAEAPYEQSDYKQEEKIHTTSRGLKVRSRAELLIAEMLYRFDIPFRYEQVLYVGKYKLAPDFTFLDWQGREFYWEYCGKMKNLEYVAKQQWRRRTYEGVGVTEWENMIYTYDDADGVDMREIEAIIKTKILPRMVGEQAAA